MTQVTNRLTSQPGNQVAIQVPQNQFVAELFTIAEALEPPAEKIGSKSGQNDAILYSMIASDVLNRVNPFPSAPILRNSALRVKKVDVAPGMAVETAGGLQLVKAVGDSRVRLFSSSRWMTMDELTAVYDLSGLPMPRKILIPVPLQKVKNVKLYTKDQPQNVRPPIQQQITVQKNRGANQTQTGIVTVTNSEKYRASAQQFSGGFGEFHFGMSPAEVNNSIRGPFEGSSYMNFPVAQEFKKNEVRYFWTRLSQIQNSEGVMRYISLLSPFKSCMQDGAQSYVTFLFSNEKLIRISSRSLSDCSGREALFQDFVHSLGVSVVIPDNAHGVTMQFGSTNLTWNLGTEGDVLDVWEQGSPVPDDIFNPVAPSIPPSVTMPPLDQSPSKNFRDLPRPNGQKPR